MRKHQHEKDPEVDPSCRLCDTDDLETPWHILTDCPRLGNRRNEIYRAYKTTGLGQIRKLAHFIECEPILRVMTFTT